MKWQPIETAPKDGTIVDLFVKVGRYSGRATDHYWQVRRKVWRCVSGGDLKPMYATHWMPLPAPPQ